MYSIAALSNALCIPQQLSGKLLVVLLCLLGIQQQRLDLRALTGPVKLDGVKPVSLSDLPNIAREENLSAPSLRQQVMILLLLIIIVIIIIITIIMMMIIDQTQASQGQVSMEQVSK